MNKQQKLVAKFLIGVMWLPTVFASYNPASAYVVEPEIAETTKPNQTLISRGRRVYGRRGYGRRGYGRRGYSRGGYSRGGYSRGGYVYGRGGYVYGRGGYGRGRVRCGRGGYVYGRGGYEYDGEGYEYDGEGYEYGRGGYGRALRRGGRGRGSSVITTGRRERNGYSESSVDQNVTVPHVEDPNDFIHQEQYNEARRQLELIQFQEAVDNP